MEKLVEFDLHIHSKYSLDSLMEPKTILKTATRRGLSFIAVTDHDTIRGGFKTFKEKRQIESGVEVIVGSEISTDAGDIIGLFLNEEIRNKEIGDVIDEIHSQGGIVLLPHPLRGHNMPIISHLLNKIDLVELLNSRTPLTVEDHSLIRGFGKRLVGCSDAHFACEIGLCRTCARSPVSPLEFRKLKHFLSMLSVVEIKGNFSPPYLSSYSNLIKSVRLRQFSQTPIIAMQAAYQAVSKL